MIAANTQQQPDPPQQHVVDAGLVTKRLQILAQAVDNCLAPLRTLLAGLETGATCSDKSSTFSQLLKQCQAGSDALQEIGAACQVAISEVEQAKVPLTPAGDQPSDNDKITHVVQKVSAAHGNVLDRVEQMEERLKGLKALKESGAVMVPIILVIDTIELIQAATCRDVISIDAALTAIGR